MRALSYGLATRAGGDSGGAPRFDFSVFWQREQRKGLCVRLKSDTLRVHICYKNVRRRCAMSLERLKMHVPMPYPCEGHRLSIAVHSFRGLRTVGSKSIVFNSCWDSSVQPVQCLIRGFISTSASCPPSVGGQSVHAVEHPQHLEQCDATK